MRRYYSVRQSCVNRISFIEATASNTSEENANLTNNQPHLLRRSINRTQSGTCTAGCTSTLVLSSKQATHRSVVHVAFFMSRNWRLTMMARAFSLVRMGLPQLKYVFISWFCNQMIETKPALCAWNKNAPQPHLAVHEKRTNRAK